MEDHVYIKEEEDGDITEENGFINYKERPLDIKQEIDIFDESDLELKEVDGRSSNKLGLGKDNEILRLEAGVCPSLQQSPIVLSFPKVTTRRRKYEEKRYDDQYQALYSKRTECQTLKIKLMKEYQDALAKENKESRIQQEWRSRQEGLRSKTNEMRIEQEKNKAEEEALRQRLHCIASEISSLTSCRMKQSFIKLENFLAQGNLSYKATSNSFE